MDKIKVLVVDDSAFMRKVITDLLASEDVIDVVGTARNGQDALHKIKQFKPDVVTLDIEMPKMDGLEALKIIMKEQPTPVVMLSSTTQKGAENTVLAMQYGAVDFIAKPSGAISLDLHKVKGELIKKVVLASRVKLNHLTKTIPTKRTSIQMERHNRIDIQKQTEKVQRSHIDFSEKLSKDKIICIGTSTGGPRALQTVLTAIPEDVDAPILIVQHMPPGFTNSLAKRLDTLCDITVKEAADGDIVQKGTAYIAPGGYHINIIKNGINLTIKLDKSPPRNGHRPAVDVLFESVSNLSDYSKIAVVMTGMGSDGARGLMKLKRSGTVKAIAESEETSIVFGMPKAAIDTQLVDEIQAVDNIANTIMKFV